MGEARLDIARVRGRFPGLSDGLVHVESPMGTLLPEDVVHAMTQAMRVPVAPRGGVFPASARAEGLAADLAGVFWGWAISQGLETISDSTLALALMVTVVGFVLCVLGSVFVTRIRSVA